MIPSFSAVDQFLLVMDAAIVSAPLFGARIFAHLVDERELPLLVWVCGIGLSIRALSVFVPTSILVGECYALD